MSEVVNETNLVDQQNPIMDDAKGVVITDSTPAEVVAPVDGAHVKASFRKEKTVPDKPWTQEDRVERKIKLPDITWAFSATQGTVLAVLDVPRDLLQNDISAEPFERFEYVHYEFVDIHINVVGNRLVQGLVGAYLIRTQTPNFKPLGNLTSLTTLDHLHLQANEDTSGVLRLPFTYFKDWLNLRTDDTLGQLAVVVFNQATATSSAPFSSLLIKSWASFVGTQFRVPRNQIASPLNTPASIKHYRRYEKRIRESIEEENLRREYEIPPLARRNMKEVPPLVRRNMSFLASLAGPFLGAIANTIVPKVVSKVGDNLDKPQIGATIEQFSRKEQNFLTQSEGPEMLSYFGFKPSSVQTVDEDHYNTSVNEMSLDYLLQEKPSYITTVDISTQTPLGAELFNIKVGPNGTFPFNNPGLQNVSMIDFWSRFYNLWRGPFKYVIEGVMTSFHEFRIDFVYTIDIDQALPWDDAITQYYHTVVFRAESNTFGFILPFFSSTPFKRIYTGETPLSLDPTPTDKPFEEYFTGTFGMYLSNQLIAPEAVAPRVQLNVYQLAGPGFEFAAPTYFGNNLTSVEAGIQGTVEPPMNRIPRARRNMGPEMARNQVDQKDNNDSQIQTGDNYNWNMPHSTQPCQVFGNDTHDQSYTDEHIGERNMDLREMLKRYTSFGRFKLQFPSDQTIVNDIIAGERPLINVIDITDPLTGAGFSGAESFVSTCFRNVRGPECLKVRAHVEAKGELAAAAHHGWASFIPYSSAGAPSIDDVQVLATQFPSVLGAKTFNQLAPRAFFNERQTAEFKIPYYYHTKSALLLKQYDIADPLLRFKQDNIFSMRLVIAIYVPGVSEQTDSIFVDIDRSFADEKQFGVWVGLPRVAYTQVYPSGPLP